MVHVAEANAVHVCAVVVPHHSHLQPHAHLQAHADAIMWYSCHIGSVISRHQEMLSFKDPVKSLCKLWHGSQTGHKPIRMCVTWDDQRGCGSLKLSSSCAGEEATLLSCQGHYLSLRAQSAPPTRGFIHSHPSKLSVIPLPSREILPLLLSTPDFSWFPFSCWSC